MAVQAHAQMPAQGNASTDDASKAQLMAQAQGQNQGQGQGRSQGQQGQATNPPAQSSKPQNDRIFGVLPNYLTVANNQKLPPLTTRQKYGLVADGTFDKIELLFIATLAGVNQWENENPTWGQGLKGYARRYGEQFANNGIENFMVGGVYPGFLHQDPRYYQLGHGSYFKRALYSASRLAITKGDSGHMQFNISEFGGGISAAALGNLYEPRGERTVENTFSTWGDQLAIDCLSSETKEFWPDIKNGFRHMVRSHRQPPTHTP